MKKTVPLYWGERDDPRRRVVGSVEVDTETGALDAKIVDEDAKAMLTAADPIVNYSIGPKRPRTVTRADVDEFIDRSLERATALRIKGTLGEAIERSLDREIERLHGPGAVEALEAAFKDGSIFNQ